MAGPLEEPVALTAVDQLRERRRLLDVELGGRRRREAEALAALERERDFIRAHEASIANIDAAIAKLSG